MSPHASAPSAASPKQLSYLKALAQHALEGVQAGQPARYMEDGDGRHDLALAFAEHFYDTAIASSTGTTWSTPATTSRSSLLGVH